MSKYTNLNDPLHGIQIHELHKYLPYLTCERSNDYLHKKKGGMYYCALCNSTSQKVQHTNSKKHIFNIHKLEALRKANIQQYLSRNYRYIDISNRRTISLMPINIPNENIDINPHFMCPISMEIMKEPVLAADGNTYDRKSIEKWFQTSSKSPITNLEIDKVLTPNIALYHLIQECLQVEHENS